VKHINIVSFHLIDFAFPAREKRSGKVPISLSYLSDSALELLLRIFLDKFFLLTILNTCSKILKMGKRGKFTPIYFEFSSNILSQSMQEGGG